MNTFSRKLIAGVVVVEILVASIVTFNNETVDFATACLMLLFLSLPKFLVLATSNLKKSRKGRARAVSWATGFAAIDVVLLAVFLLPNVGETSNALLHIMTWLIWLFVGLFLSGVAVLGAPRHAHRRSE